MEKSNKKFYIFLIIAALPIIVLIVIIVLVLSQSTKPESSTTENQLPFTEITSQTSINNETQNLIIENIGNAISLVSSTIRISINDIKVRKDSIISNYDEPTDVHYGNFIVDIPVLRQSYFIQYEWSDNKENSNLSGYPILVTCLRDESKIIYSDFKCKDIFDLDN